MKYDYTSYHRDDYEKDYNKKTELNYKMTNDTPEPRKKKKGRGLKITAICLAMALVLGAGAWGGYTALSGLADRLGDNVVESNVQTSESESSANNAESVTQGTDVLALKTFKQDSTAMSAAEIYQEYVESVVAINSESTYTNLFGQTAVYPSSGTGFIITEDGYILTNNHVVEDSSSISVVLNDGETYQAQIIGTDPNNDVALIKIDATGLSPVNIGDSDQIMVGEDVAVIGNPLGELTNTLTTGVVSATDRLINIDGTPINMFQIDAAVNAGNSGGPVFDATGRVIGIVSAKYADSEIEGLGFAIPINDAMDIAQQLLEDGYVSGYPTFNIQAGTMDSTYAAYYDVPVGAYVTEVTANGAGSKAGLQVGDIITRIDDTEITSRDDLTEAKLKYSAGDTVKLVVYRNGEYLTLSLTFDDENTQIQEPVQSIPYSNGGFPSGGM